MIQLLDLAVRAHGGLDAWRSIKSIELKASLNGELLRIKGHPEGIIDVLIHIEAREPALTITPFGRPDFAGHFLPDRVWLEGNGSGKEQVLRNPRRSFEGHSTRLPHRGRNCKSFTSLATQCGTILRLPFCLHPLT